MFRRALLIITVLQCCTGTPQLGNPESQGVDGSPSDSTSGFSSAAAYEVTHCNCAGCVHPYMNMTGVHFAKLCFDTCSTDGDCLVALHDAYAGTCFFYDHAKETVMHSKRKRDRDYRCFVKATACTADTPCDHLQGIESPVFGPQPRTRAWSKKTKTKRLRRKPPSTQEGEIGARGTAAVKSTRTPDTPSSSRRGWHCKLTANMKCKLDRHYSGAIVSMKGPELCRQACAKWHSFGCQFNAIHNECLLDWPAHAQCVPTLSVVPGKLSQDFRQFFAGNCYGKHGPAMVPAPETLAPETLAPLQGQEGLGNKARAQRVSRVAGRHGETRKAARWASRKEVATHVRPIQKPEFEARLPPHTAPTSKIYKWHASPWGVCSLSCGEGGIRLRKVTCQSMQSQGPRKDTRDELCEQISENNSKPAAAGGCGRQIKPCLKAPA